MKLKMFASFTFALLLSGCASFSGGPEPLLSIDEEIETLTSSFDSTQVQKYFTDDLGVDARKGLRNKIVATRLYAIDLRFSEYQQTLAKELRGGAFGMDLISIALTGAATVIDPSTTTTILAGTDTALKGGRQSFTKEILIDKTLPVLIAQMRADRKKIATQIWYSLANSNDAEYSLPLALSQLEDYYQAGTIAGALISMGESAALISAKASKDFKNTVLQINYGENQYTKLLNEYVDAGKDQAQKDARLQEIQTKIDDLNKSDEDVLAAELMYTTQPEYHLLQKQVVKALNLGGN